MKTLKTLAAMTYLAATAAIAFTCLCSVAAGGSLVLLPIGLAVGYLAACQMSALAS